MNNLSVFNFESHELRVLGDAENPLFVLKDICKCLELENAGQVASRLDEDEYKVTIISSDSTQELDKGREMIVVTEPGLYSVILGCRKPQAKPFKRWVTHEVLPSIRKTGSYSRHPEENQATTQDRVKTIDDLAKVVKILKEAQKLDPTRKKMLEAEAFSMLHLSPEDQAALQAEEAPEPIEPERHLTIFCVDVGLKEHRGGQVAIGEIWERLKQWYVEKGLLKIEMDKNEKEKLVWLGKASAYEENVKAINQLSARLLKIFPNAKKKRKKNGNYLEGIVFEHEKVLYLPIE
ncbi:MAG: hypothetical protein J7647_01660 [Cyanobacteria bacterium SBLK]|nr:hypothetical protein [Cyanobacteria bacterium SBLK]